MTAPLLTRIMIVDDDPGIQALARVALGRVGGFTVEIYSSGSEAIERAQNSPPDLILLDANMPVMDGPATIRALKKNPQTAPIPVIFITASTQPDEIEQYKKLGAIDSISKPFNPMSLSQSVKDIWGQYHKNI